MSQEKVARYKEEKANRKEMMKKAKRKTVIWGCIGSIAVVITLGWIGYSGVEKIIDSIPRDTIIADYTALTEYQTALTADEDAKEEKEDAAKTDTDTEKADETEATE